MKKACLIGLGSITQRYIQGFRKSSFLELCAVSDIKEDAAGRPFYPSYPFYPDYKQMLDRQQPAYVIISTPPEHHFEIAAYCLQHGVNVLVEKPATLCMEHFDLLTRLAKERHLVFRTMFHWHGGIETLAFNRRYDLSRIQQIRINVLDPYCTDGETIRPDRRPLMGAWVDSGVNILSLLRTWLPFTKTEVLHTEAQRCKETTLPIYVKVNLRIDGIPAEIVVDWRQGREQKESFVQVENRWVHIDHSGQRIEDSGVTEYARMPRLDEHYQYLFETMEDSSNDAFSRSVHEVLFRVGETL